MESYKLSKCLNIKFFAPMFAPMKLTVRNAMDKASPSVGKVFITVGKSFNSVGTLFSSVGKSSISVGKSFISVGKSPSFAARTAHVEVWNVGTPTVCIERENIHFASKEHPRLSAALHTGRRGDLDDVKMCALSQRESLWDGPPPTHRRI